MRKPNCNPPEWCAPKTPGQSTDELTIRVITPMFGGGFDPGVVDEVNPIRSAAIRGHLRFWWRAVAGGTFKTAQELHAAESSIWGSAEEPGKVALAISHIRPGEVERCAEYLLRRDGTYGSIPDFGGKPGYALFPFQGAAKKTYIEQQPANCAIELEFTLFIKCPKLTADAYCEVEAAVAAWIAYGGVGSRTRRGCGSLNLKCDSPEIRVTAARSLLSNARYVRGKVYDSPIDAWRAAVEVYRDFRQGVGHARSGGKDGRPGRSRWPEPDSIRRITSRHSEGHAPNPEVRSGFPRADLGLPIVFHFKDERSDDPPDTMLERPLDGAHRFASPVITKAISSVNGFRPLVLVLNSQHVWDGGDLRITSLGGSNRSAAISREQVELSATDAAVIPPLVGRSDIREALLKYVSGRWNENVENLP